MHNLKNVKNTHGGVLLLVKLQAEAHLHCVKDSGEHPSGLSQKEVRSNSIFCNGYQHSIYNTSTGSKDNLKVCPSYRCERSLGLCRLTDGRLEKFVAVNDMNLGIIIIIVIKSGSI